MLLIVADFDVVSVDWCWCLSRVPFGHALCFPRLQRRAVFLIEPLALLIGCLALREVFIHWVAKGFALNSLLQEVFD